MSVLIKGMEMPTACYKCELYESETYWCRGAKREVEDPFSDGGVATFCPLVPVPPHGDLIDRDALPYENLHILLTDDNDWGLPISDIENAPTILEAEEGE